MYNYTGEQCRGACVSGSAGSVQATMGQDGWWQQAQRRLELRVGRQRTHRAPLCILWPAQAVAGAASCCS